jgi:hypothetical protein
MRSALVVSFKLTTHNNVQTIWSIAYKQIRDRRVNVSKQQDKA